MPHKIPFHHPINSTTKLALLLQKLAHTCTPVPDIKRHRGIFHKMQNTMNLHDGNKFAIKKRINYQQRDFHGPF